MAGPGYADIPLYHGDTLSFTASVSDDVDMSGHVPLFQVRQNGILLADWSSYVMVDAQTVTVQVPGEPDPSGTGAIPRPRREGRFDYDLQLTSPAGIVRTILRGNLLVMGDVSHG